MPLDKEKTSHHIYHFHALVLTLQRTFKGLNLLMTEYLWNIKLSCQYTCIYDFLNLFIYFTFHWDLSTLYSCSFDKVTSPLESLLVYILSPNHNSQVIFEIGYASPDCLSFVQVKEPSMFISLPSFYCSICVVLLIYISVYCISESWCYYCFCKYSVTLWMKVAILYVQYVMSFFTHWVKSISATYFFVIKGVGIFLANCCFLDYMVLSCLS